MVNAQGKTVARLVAGVMQTTVLCSGSPRIATLDSAPLSLPYSTSGTKRVNATAPHFAYRAIEADQVHASYGISTELPPATGTACMAYNEVTGPGSPPDVLGGYSFATDLVLHNENSPITFASMEEAKAFMETAEYQDAKAVIMSLQVVQQ